MDRRRRRRQSRPAPLPTLPVPCRITHDFHHPVRRKSWSFFSAFFNLLLMSSLIASIYMMLDYHCTQCSSKCENSITKSLEEITQNLSFMNNNYQDLEDKVIQFSRELPKLEGQIEILEALANNNENSKFAYQKIHLSLPNVADPPRANVGNISAKPLRTSVPVKKEY